MDKEIIEKVRACQNMEEFEKVLSEIETLLNDKEKSEIFKSIWIGGCSRKTFDFYCKLVEKDSRFLTYQYEDGGRLLKEALLREKNYGQTNALADYYMKDYFNFLPLIKEIDSDKVDIEYWPMTKQRRAEMRKLLNRYDVERSFSGLTTGQKIIVGLSVPIILPALAVKAVAGIGNGVLRLTGGLIDELTYDATWPYSALIKDLSKGRTLASYTKRAGDALANSLRYVGSAVKKVGDFIAYPFEQLHESICTLTGASENHEVKEIEKNLANVVASDYDVKPRDLQVVDLYCEDGKLNLKGIFADKKFEYKYCLDDKKIEYIVYGTYADTLNNKKVLNNLSDEALKLICQTTKTQPDEKNYSDEIKLSVSDEELWEVK